MKDLSSDRLTIRSVLIGLILIPVNCFWIIQFEFNRWSFPTYLVPYYNVIFCLVLLVGVSILIKRISPAWALTPSELLVSYLMMCMASSICSHNMMEILVTSMGHAFWFSTPENEWQNLILPHLPSWLTVSDKISLLGYYEGETTLYHWTHVRPWIEPFIWWLLFTMALLGIMLCINVVLRKQWIETEKLTYPIIQLPLSIMDPKLHLLRNRSLWLGFSITGGLTLVNGLAILYPVLPSIPLKRILNLHRLLTDRPWNAIGWTPVTVHPHLIGLGFLMPIDLLFSAWFFYWVLKAQRIFSSDVGLQGLPNFPYAKEQSFGAYIAIILAVLWAGRHHFQQVGLSLFRSDKDQPDIAGGISNRAAVIGIILGFVFLCFFSVQAGMGIWLSVAFFFLYYLLSTAITRMRAELGFPIHDAHYPLGPDHIAIIAQGTRRLGPKNLAVLALYHWFNRTYASHPMPHQLEGFKMSDQLRISTPRVSRNLIWILMLAIFTSVVSTFWLILDSFYRRGSASGFYTWWGSGGFGRETFRWLESWLLHRTEPDLFAIGAVSVGFLLSIGMMFLRLHFLWWPFHPLGYAISSSWGIHVWSSFLISWIVKLIVLRYGGLRSYRQTVPFFLGIILGEYMVGSVWNLVSIIFNIPTYQFTVG